MGKEGSPPIEHFKNECTKGIRNIFRKNNPNMQYEKTIKKEKIFRGNDKNINKKHLFIKKTLSDRIE